MVKARETKIFSVRIDSELMRVLKEYADFLLQRGHSRLFAAGIRMFLSATLEDQLKFIREETYSREDFDLDKKMTDPPRFTKPKTKNTSPPEVAPLPAELEPLIEQITNAVLAKLDGELPEKPAISPQAAAIRDLILKKKGIAKK